MIVVIGSPLYRPGSAERPSDAAGLAVDIARASAEAGASVQLVGRVGEDPAGDATLLALTGLGIGHVATLRDPARPTPVEPIVVGSDAELLSAAIADPDDAPPDGAGDGGWLGGDDASTLDPDDVGMALRYLDDQRVIVVAESMAPDGLRVVSDAAAFGGARLVVIVAEGRAVASDLAGATVIEAPPSDPDGVFARTVGRFAVALDAGADPATALGDAVAAGGWERSLA